MNHEQVNLATFTLCCILRAACKRDMHRSPLLGDFGDVKHSITGSVKPSICLSIGFALKYLQATQISQGGIGVVFYSTSYLFRTQPTRGNHLKMTSHRNNTQTVGFILPLAISSLFAQNCHSISGVCKAWPQ